MNFTDLIFLFCFLPITVLLYRFVGKTKFANLFILAASLVFYAMGSLSSLFLLAVVIVWNYVSCKKIDGEEDPEKRKKQMLLAAGIDLLILFFYRYLGVWFGFLDAMAPFDLRALPSKMPAGLSFYLFSCLSAIFDVYRKKAPALNSLVDFGVFAAFFGRVNMGPIAHYSQFVSERNNHPITRKKNANGMALFMQGMFRKVILADNFALIFRLWQEIQAGLAICSMDFPISFSFTLIFRGIQGWQEESDSSSDSKSLRTSICPTRHCPTRISGDAGTFH